MREKMKKEIEEQIKREKALQKRCKFEIISGVLFMCTIIGIPIGFILIIVFSIISNNCGRKIIELEGKK